MSGKYEWFREYFINSVSGQSETSKRMDLTALNMKRVFKSGE